MSKEERIKRVLLDMTESEIVETFNEYCFRNSYYEDEYIPMCEFDDLCSGMKPTEIVEYVKDRDFNTNDDYYKETIFGPVSYSTKESADEIWANNLDDLVKHIIGNDDSLNNGDIAEILDEETEAED